MKRTIFGLCLFLFSTADFLFCEIQTMTLSNVVETSLRNNLDIQQASKDVAIARAQYDESFADFALPSISLSGGVNYLDPLTISNSILTTPSSYSVIGSQVFPASFSTTTNIFADNYSAGLSISKPLFTGFKLWDSLQMERISLDLAEKKLEDKKKEVINNVQISFYNLFLLKENVNLTADLDKSLKERLNFSQANYNAGLVSEYDYISAQVQYLNNQPKLFQKKNAYIAAKIAFCNTIGVKDSDQVEFIGNLMDSTNIQLYHTNLSESIVLALSNDISLQSLAYSLETLKFSKGIAEAGRYPYLAGNFSYQYNYKKQTLSDTDRTWVPSWNIGLQLSVPLDGWIPISRTAKSLQELDETIAKTELTMKQAEDGIVLQVKTFFMQIEEAKQTMAGQSENVKQARLGYKLANTRYREGTSSSLEVTDAEVSLNQAEVNYLQAIYNYFSSVLKLKKMVSE
jgi:outer membrane protein TolC